MANDDPIERQFPMASWESEELTDTPLGCEQWEALATEAAEGTLSENQMSALEQHRGRCRSCDEIWERSRQGAQWLHFLGERAEPPAGLAEAIIAATSGVDRTALRERPALPSGAWSRNPFLPRRNAPAVPGSSGYGAPALVAPGFLMTTAMAFFSLALTVYLLAAPFHRGNLHAQAAAGAGPLPAVHLSSLTPSALRRAVVRQYYSLEERGAKFYDNLLVVREAEAEVRALSAFSSTQPHEGAEPQRLGPFPISRNGGGAPAPHSFGRAQVASLVDSQLRLPNGSGAHLVSPQSPLDQRMSSFSYQGTRA